MEARVSRKLKTVWHYNPVSGHEWSEDIPTSRFEVTGCGFLRTEHATKKGAIREKKERESMIAKFPFILHVPLSDHEMKVCKYSGIPIRKALLSDEDFRKAVEFGIEVE